MRVRVLLWGLAAAGVLALAVIVFTPLGVPLLQRLFPVGVVEPVDFATLNLDNLPARYLVCPEVETCPELNDRTAIFDVSLERLRAEFDRILATEVDLELVLADDETMQYTFLSRNAFLQLPDLFTVQFIIPPEADENFPRSTMILYSRRVYASGDFGVNSARVIRFLDQLEATLGIYRR